MSVHQHIETAQSQMLASAMIVTAVSLFAIGDMFSKIVSTGSGPLMALWGRHIFLFLLVSPLLIQERPSDLFRGRNAPLLAFRSLMPVLSGLTVIVAMKFLPIAQVTAVIFIAPIISLALARVILDEPVNALGWLAVFVGFLGVLLITRPGTASFSWYMVLPVIGGIGIACNQVVTRHLATRIRARTALLHVSITGLVVSTALLPFGWHPMTALEWGMTAVTGLMQAIGQFLFLAAFARARASAVAPFTYAQLVMAAICGYLVFGEVLTPAALTGAVLITGAGLVTLVRRR
ncbi:DMT family transporter [Pseudochelatococcus sp. B33]